MKSLIARDTLPIVSDANSAIVEVPEVKPLKSDSGPTVKQPKAPFRALPANSLHIGPSGSGKSLTLLRTLMDADKLGGLFDRYSLTPSTRL